MRRNGDVAGSVCGGNGKKDAGSAGRIQGWFGRQSTASIGMATMFMFLADGDSQGNGTYAQNPTGMDALISFALPA